MKDPGYSLLLAGVGWGLYVRVDIIKDVYVGLGIIPGWLDRVSEK